MYSTANERGQHEQDSIDSQLSQIRSYIENEIARRDVQLEALQEKLNECKQTMEGQRQLINKLLNDIGNYQKDIIWYKRTYEQRSLLGLLKDKFLGKSSAENSDKHD